MSHAAPVVVFCTTCKGRRQHVEQTLPLNLSDNADYPAFKVVLLDYDSPDGLGEWVAANHAADLEAGRLVYYRSPYHPKFKMAHAKNMAHRLGLLEGADILVNMDADNFGAPGFARHIAEKFAGAEAEREAIYLRPRQNHIGPGHDSGDRTPPGVHGRIAVSARAFLQAGGYDECYESWSPDDKDFAIRLERLGYVRHGFARRFLQAIKHGDKLRFKNYGPDGPKSREAAAGAWARLEDRTDVSVSNFGRFGLGVTYRNFSGEPTKLGPLPTRVFGVGLHKTATTSFAKALETLGLDCAHWETPQFAQAVFKEMAERGRSRTLEAYNCAADLPVPLFFRELDAAYPGSKFVLTIRSEAEWLQSMRKHWARYADGWEADPFSNEMHRLLYGREDFDPETMLARYRRHNGEVISHFAGRPGDLLVMDMSADAGWRALCDFLQVPQPSVPYPREFVTDPPETYTERNHYARI